LRCRDEPIACRKKIAAKYGLEPNRDKSWQFEGRCPNCGHGGFSIIAPDRASTTLRHIWACNCKRCACDATDVREAMLEAAIPRACLGTYGRPVKAKPGTEGGEMVAWADIDKVLRDPDVRAVADLRIRVREARFGPAPGGWEEFIAFAAAAGVPRTGRYDAAARMRRRRLPH
jgi:hypothetical protein